MSEIQYVCSYQFGPECRDFTLKRDENDWGQSDGICSNCTAELIRRERESEPAPVHVNAIIPSNLAKIISEKAGLRGLKFGELAGELI